MCLILKNADFSSRQIADLAKKIEKTTGNRYTVGTASSDLDGLTMTPTKSRPTKGRKPDSESFDKIITDSERISSEEVHGLLTQVLKDRLFNGVRYIKGANGGEAVDGGEMQVTTS